MVTHLKIPTDHKCFSPIKCIDYSAHVNNTDTYCNQTDTSSSQLLTPLGCTLASMKTAHWKCFDSCVVMTVSYIFLYWYYRTIRFTVHILSNKLELKRNLKRPNSVSFSFISNWSEQEKLLLKRSFAKAMFISVSCHSLYQLVWMRFIERGWKQWLPSKVYVQVCPWVHSVCCFHLVITEAAGQDKRNFCVNKFNSCLKLWLHKPPLRYHWLYL